MMIELIKMTLNHGVYTTRTATSATEVADALAEWQPHLAILDMDLDGMQVMKLFGATPVGGIRLPVIGLTRRGDLKTKLASFEAGVDDILTGRENYVALVNQAYGLTAKTRLPAKKLSGVLALVAVEVKTHFQTLPPGVPEFDHFFPSSYLVENAPSVCGPSSPISPWP
jgi:DNA-binding response OmpR family regulator